MLGHASAWLQPISQPKQWLAVDLFFLLSGFVLAKVYDPRFRAGMTSRQFMIQRYVRLYPLYLIGTLVGIVSAIGTLATHHGALSGGALAVATVSGLAMLPSPTGAWVSDVMPLNNPGWSLFFELVANLVYALLWRRLTLRTLIAIVAVSASALIYYYANGEASGGTDWHNFGWGFPRVFFSFFAGVLIGRLFHPRPIKTRWSWVPPLCLFPLMLTHPPMGMTLDLITILFGFPCLVMISAVLQPPQPKLFEQLGTSSYPIYAVHQPILFVLMRVMLFLHISVTAGAPATGILFAVAMVPFGLLLDRLYDQPARRWLTARFVDRKLRSAVEAEPAL